MQSDKTDNNEFDLEKLKKFYGVTTDIDLIKVQAKSIEKLQQRLARLELNVFKPTFPRG